MSFLFPKVKVPPPPAMPDANAPEIAAARDRQRKIAAASAGSKANWLTGSAGLPGAAPVAYKMLLGS